MKKTALFFAMAIAVVALGACATPAPQPTATPATSAASTSVPTKAPAAATPTTAAKAPATTIVPTPAPARVKVGIIGSGSDAPLFIADDKGFFKAQGIEVEYVNFKSATEMVAPVGTGELDVGSLVISPGLLNAKDRGVDIRLVASKSRSRPGFESYWILLRKDLADSSQVKTPADLKGTKMAVFSRGSVAQQAAELVLAKGG
ncbi:MAG: ABC transporter substrate-binding protein, partial [Dehalococcoidia bacterium]|nr:ABC transporter substrate-binding protein [Dehalococcoidia bacterium]